MQMRAHIKLANRLDNCFGMPAKARRAGKITYISPLPTLTPLLVSHTTAGPHRGRPDELRGALTGSLRRGRTRSRQPRKAPARPESRKLSQCFAAGGTADTPSQPRHHVPENAAIFAQRQTPQPTGRRRWACPRLYGAGQEEKVPRLAFRPFVRPSAQSTRYSKCRIEGGITFVMFPGFMVHSGHPLTILSVFWKPGVFFSLANKSLSVTWWSYQAFPNQLILWVYVCGARPRSCGFRQWIHERQSSLTPG